jgi:hypothetical protein
VDNIAWRYEVVEVPRADGKARDDLMWEMGRSGWELVQVLEGSAKDAADRSTLLLFFKRSASEDIGV